MEAALSDHFGTPVTLVLDIDETVAPPMARAGPSPAASPRARGAAPAPSAPPIDDVEDMDPGDMLDDTSTDQASAAEARLLQAFPGASEVAE